MRSKLIEITVTNLGCIGNNGLTVALDNILCLVGNNNTGKSTVLRAYELAVGTEQYDSSRDKCNFSDEPTSVEITAHIPEGVGNIAEKWKISEGELRLVKSKWTWDELGNKSRFTFDPENNDYSVDGNAAGLDNVFNSRLPKPYRIGALESPEAELKNLLKLIVEPISKKLKKNIEDEQSEMNKALANFKKEAQKPVEEEAEKIQRYNKGIGDGHSSIFPDLTMDLTIELGEIKIDPVGVLLQGSNLNIKEFGKSVVWNQQGTGSQRALFWSLLQVRSKLQAINDLKKETEKRISQIGKEISKLEKERDKAAKVDTQKRKQSEIDEKKEELQKLQDLNFEETLEESNEEVSLPGHMLLIDEPEIALHPNGIRAASQYLYELVKDSGWQVMLTTHSPLFINPFEDNTTIVRLTRNKDELTPKTYRTESVSYSQEEKEQLTLLNSFDQNLSEMFFGQQPILVEGDTEFAAFQQIMELDPEKYPISLRPIIIRARGKYTLRPLIKMLKHFRVNFSILHDSDFPKNKNGDANGVWTFNSSLYEEIEDARKLNLRVVHRVSISTFEVEHMGIDTDGNGIVNLPKGKDKPFEIYSKIKSDKVLKESIVQILDELISKDSVEHPFDGNKVDSLKKHFQDWVKTNNIRDHRFIQN